MAVVLRVTTADGDLLFEVDPTEADLMEIGAADRAKDIIKSAAATSYEAVTTTIRRCTQELLPTINEIATERSAGGALSSAQLEVGVKITAEGNVLVAKGTAEAHIKLSLTWDLAGR